MMKFVIGFLLAASVQAHADVHGYEAAFTPMIQNYLSQVAGSTPYKDPMNCQPMYAKMLQDGVLDIRYAFGYFDFTTGERHKVGANDWGYSPSLDISAFRALRQNLRNTCTSRNARLCGFSESGDVNSGRIVFTKNEKIFGQKVLVRITMTVGSASESFEDNKGNLAGRQRNLTAQGEDNFFNGLKNADIVFYNGHSRNGGGPDFNPPILNSHMKTDYKGYYEPKRIGITRMLQSIPQNPNKGFIFGMFSCYAQKHFYGDFTRLNPNQHMILSSDTIDYSDAMVASVGYLESFLHGLCGSQLSKTAKQNPKVMQGFTDFNMN